MKIVVILLNILEMLLVLPFGLLLPLYVGKHHYAMIFIVLKIYKGYWYITSSVTQYARKYTYFAGGAPMEVYFSKKKRKRECEKYDIGY